MLIGKNDGIIMPARSLKIELLSIGVQGNNYGNELSKTMAIYDWFKAVFMFLMKVYSLYKPLSSDIECEN